MAICAIEADLNIPLRSCKNSRISRYGKVAQESGFSEESKSSEAVVVLSYYGASLDFVDCGGREEWLQDENHGCSVQGGGLRFEVYDALRQDRGVDGMN